MPTPQQRDPGLETVNKKEVINAIGNALNHFLASPELQEFVDARVKALVALETAKWGGLAGEGVVDPYAHGYKTQGQLQAEALAKLPETSL